MPARVLVVNKFLHHVGGVETYVKWLSTHLAAEGIDLAFLGMPAPAGSREMELNGPTFHTPSRDFHGSPVTKARSAASSVYSRAVVRSFQRAVEAFRPDVVHFQSTCFQLTSSPVRECMRLRVPSIMTAHDHFLVCSNQRLWDDGQGSPCTKCIGANVPRRALSMVSTRCVKASTLASAVAAVELPISHSVWSKYDGLVHAPSRYMRDMLSTAGSPVRDKVRHLELSWGKEVTLAGSEPIVPTATFFGRLSREKGVKVLLDAWPEVMRRVPDARLNIYGSGDQEELVRERTAGLSGVNLLGRFDVSDLPEILASATVTVHPSECAENSPYTVRESLQAGVPVVVTDVGGMPELVGAETGIVAPRTSPAGLADALVAELTAKRGRTLAFREAVRQRASSDQKHLLGLRELYDEAARRAAAGASAIA